MPVAAMPARKYCGKRHAPGQDVAAEHRAEHDHHHDRVGEREHHLLALAEEQPELEPDAAAGDPRRRRRSRTVGQDGGHRISPSEPVALGPTSWR